MLIIETKSEAYWRKVEVCMCLNGAGDAAWVAWFRSAALLTCGDVVVTAQKVHVREIFSQSSATDVRF